ncbi:MAG: hypothetical protein ACOYNL_04685 [Rickettsiales bacterium]
MKIKRHQIYIYDHPESKIQFMEQTLAGKDWRATLVYPDNNPEDNGNIIAAKQAFEKRGYHVKQSVNEHGHQLLDLHHLGDGTKPSEVLKEMGLVEGAGRLIMNPSIPLQASFAAGKTLFGKLEHAVKDPAHLNGLIYMAAEAAMLWPSKEKKLKDLEAASKGIKTRPNHWRKAAFWLFLAQSATYLFAAKNNDATSFDDFRHKIDKTMKTTGDLEDVRYDHAKDKPADGIGHTFLRLLRRFPIEAGALFNDLGMALYIVGAVKDRNHYRKELVTGGKLDDVGKSYLGVDSKGNVGDGKLNYKLVGANGYTNDMRGAITSIIAWALMLVKPKKKDDEALESDSKNPFARSWNSLRENPQVGTGLLTLVSSSQRLLGSASRADKSQLFGERIYLLGDVMLLFTKGDHYGKKTGNVDTLADTLAEYINKMPLILGPEHQEKMVKNMANYLLEKGCAEIRHNPKTSSFTEAELKERSDLLIIEVGRRVRSSYGEQMEQLGDVTAKLIGQFPTEMHAELIAHLSQSLAQLPWIYATPEELKPVLENGLKHVPPAKVAAPAPTPKSVRQAMLEIVNIMSDVDAGGSVALLYDTVAPLLSAPSTTQPGTQVSQTTRVAPLVQHAAGKLIHA